MKIKMITEWSDLQEDGRTATRYLADTEYDVDSEIGCRAIDLGHAKAVIAVVTLDTIKESQPAPYDPDGA